MTEARLIDGLNDNDDDDNDDDNDDDDNDDNDDDDGANDFDQSLHNFELKAEAEISFYIHYHATSFYKVCASKLIGSNNRLPLW